MHFTIPTCSNRKEKIQDQLIILYIRVQIMIFTLPFSFLSTTHKFFESSSQKDKMQIDICEHKTWKIFTEQNL